MTTPDPAHINILMSITHYKATEFSLSLFFFHEWKRTKRLGIKKTWGSIAVLIMTEFPCY